MNQIILFSAVVPTLLLVWYFYHRDRNPEPWKTIWGTFFLGVLTVVPILLVDLPIMSWTSTLTNSYVRALADAFITAGFTEEFFKFLVVFFFAMRTEAFDEPMDGIVYGAIASLGFATLENLLYVGDGGVSVAIIRALTAVPGHACFGAIMGYCIGQYRFRTGRPKKWLLAAYLVSAVVHGLYDFPLLAMKHVTESNPNSTNVFFLGLVSLVVLICLMIVTVRLVRKLRREQDLEAEMIQMHVPISSEGLSSTGVASKTFFPLLTVPFSKSVGRVSAPTPVAGYVMLVIGGILSTIGSLFLIGLVSAAHQGQSSWSDALLAMFFLAIPPFFLGLFLFHRGLKRLRRH